MFDGGMTPGEGASAPVDHAFVPPHDDAFVPPPDGCSPLPYGYVDEPHRGGEWPNHDRPVPDVLDEIVDSASMMAVYAAERYRRVAALHRAALTEATPFRGAVTEIIERSVRQELAMALKTTESAAEQLIHDADALVERYPELLASLGHAGTTERHAQVFVELVDPVEAELRAQVVGPGLVLAETLPLGPFRRELRKLVETVRVATLQERHAEALKSRRVVLEPAEDGMARLTVFLPAVEARAAFNRLTAMGGALKKEKCETRSIEQLRADLIGDLLIDGQVTGHARKVRGIRATVAVTVPVLSLLDDEHAKRGEPPVVEGVGPIPIGTARELCGTATGWMRVLTHPETGIVLSVGRRKYKPPPELRRFVRWRAGRCLGPGCGKAADQCEIDHQLAWADGGRTDAANLCPFCKGHHTIKHHGGWQVRQLDGSGGAIEWTSPMGRVYLVQPERTIPVFRATPEEPSLEAQGPAPF